MKEIVTHIVLGELYGNTPDTIYFRGVQTIPIQEYKENITKLNIFSVKEVVTNQRKTLFSCN